MPATALRAGSIGVNQKDMFYIEFIDSIINNLETSLSNRYFCQQICARHCFRCCEENKAKITVLVEL